jgi:hypothetical protein
VPASASAPTHIAGPGVGSVEVQVVNSNLVPDNHVYNLRFRTNGVDSIRAAFYDLIITFSDTPLDTSLPAIGLPARPTRFRITTAQGNSRVRFRFHDLDNNGTLSYVAWDLRTKDNLDIAPGMYIFHVDGNGAGSHIGKFAIIK